MSASPQRAGDGDPEVAPPADDTNDSEQKQAQDGDPGDMQDQDALYAIEVKEQDRWLPIANVARIMKTALPDNAKIAKEAKECMQECVSEFISFITSEASEKCQQEKRKTVNGEDILFAMTSLGFENYSEALKSYLARYREANVAKNDQQNRPSSGYDTSGPNPVTGGPTVAGEVEDPPSAPAPAQVNEPVVPVPTAVDQDPAVVAASLEAADEGTVIPPAAAEFREEDFAEPRAELEQIKAVPSFAAPPVVETVQTTNGESIKLAEYSATDTVNPDLAEAPGEGNGDFKYEGPADATF